MRRGLVAVISTLAVAVACSSGDPVPVGDAGPDAPVDPCAGLGCATILPTLDVTVLDATTSVPVKSPTFTEGGNVIPAACTKMIAPDGGAPVCYLWHMTNLAIGPHAIVVAASGYSSTTLNLTLAGPPNGCCGQSEQATRTVTLSTP
jgi:hypothetical protein